MRMYRSAAGLVFLASACVTGGSKADRPNVVLIIADDQAWTDFGFMGHSQIETPALDALARESAVFAHGYVPTSLCRPSLASIVTGLWPHEHGITGNDPPHGVDRARMLGHIARVETLPALLAEQGYRSLQTGKWWEGGYARGGFTHGMTHGDPKRGGRHGDAGLEIGRKTMQPILDFIDQSNGEPFFVWYAPFMPHAPHNPPARLLAKYGSTPVGRYRAMCEWFDETCGTLLRHIDERGLRDDTLVIFVSDNGWIQRPNGRGFARRSKRSPYDGGVRTPILVRWPGHVTAGERAGLASSVDIAPTILRACGARVPKAMRGIDLVSGRREAVFGATFTHDVVDIDDPAAGLIARWIVRDGSKVIAFAGPKPRVELHDLENDPYEKHDLAQADPDRTRELKKRLDAWWPGRPERVRPNLLLVVTDDQRADAAGFAGNRVIETPAMDALAARGVRFTHSFVTTAICAASRATVFTGLYRSAHGYTFGTKPLARPITDASYPARLRAAGYRTGFVGKFGVRVARGAARSMFSWFKPKSQPYFKKRKKRHLTDEVADEAISFLRAGQGVQPFSLQVSFWAPHAEDANPDQYVWPHAVDRLYEDVVFPKPAGSDPAFFAALPEFLRESLGRTRWRWRFDTEAKRQRMTRGYYRMITGGDRALARIVAALGELGLADNTVIVFTSDNGYFLGERGLAGKWLIHEPSIRVPLVIVDPRRPERAGQGSGRIVLNVDIPATLLDYAGVALPSNWQGRSLAPLARGAQPADWRRDFFYEHRFAHKAIPKTEGVRGERWVYARYYEQQPVYEELYDLKADPTESHNLAGEPAHAAQLAGMRARCEALAKQAGTKR